MNLTLDPQRTDQLRTFLVTEAASSAAARQPVLTPARRRVLAGATAVLVLGGAFATAQAVGGPAPAAIAVEVDGEWTTVRIVDIDADPDAVVAALVDAGFTAERRRFQVLRPRDGERSDVSVSWTPDGEPAPDVVGFAHSQDGGAHGLVGLSVSVPDAAEPPPPGAPEHGGVEVETDPVPSQTDGGPAVVDEDLLDAGVRFEDDGGVSIRVGTEVAIIVYTER